MVRIAVVLAGCGNKDGAEIQESVLTLLAIDMNGGQYQCFAPDVEQGRTLNFLTNEPILPARNVLIESARIARSDIKDLKLFKAEDFDILIFPGGTGVAFNLCTWATQGAQMSILPEVSKAIIDMYHAKKPIGALCISPVLVGKLIPGVKITFGEDEKVNEAFRLIGADVINTAANNIVVDEVHKVVTTPCYMLKTKPAAMFEGISKLVKELIRMTA